MSKTVKSENSTNHNAHPYMVDRNWYPDERGNYRFKFLFDRADRGELLPNHKARLEAIQEEARKSKRSKDDRIHFSPMKGRVKYEMVSNENK